jgi:hypothetical protein
MRAPVGWFRHAAIGCAMLAVCGGAAPAQPAINVPPAPNQPQIPPLKLVKDPAFKSGRAVAVQGTVAGEGLRFMIGSLSILQPGIVPVAAKSASDAIPVPGGRVSPVR